MKKTTSKNVAKDVDAKRAMLIGAGVAALTAAGIYFFGPRGERHRKQLKGWMIRMKGEIIERMEQTKDLSEDAYHQIIDTVTDRYKKHGKIAQEDIEVLAAELKKHWKGIATSGVSKNGRRQHASSRTTKGGVQKQSQKSPKKASKRGRSTTTRP